MGTWTNGSSNTYMNVSVGPSGWVNITVWVYNSTGNGNLSDGSVSANVQAPAAPTLRRGCYAGSDGGERADTDLDGYTDFNELRIGSDPYDPCDPNPQSAACLALKVAAEEVTEAEIPTSTPSPTTGPTTGPTTTAAPTTTPKKEEVPGFEAVFAIAGLLAVAYLVQRRKK